MYVPRAFAVILALSAVAGAGALAQRERGRDAQPQPGQPCPPGTTEVRPGRCQAPEFPPPSIVDYRPKSGVVTEQHSVPRAKYPVIDIHGHAAGMLQSQSGLADLVKTLDTLNVGLFVSADNSSGADLQRALSIVSSSPHANRIRILAGVNFRNVGPGWANGRWRSSKPTSRRARSASARSARASGSPPERPTAHGFAGRSGARSHLGRVRAAGRAGLHSHRRAAGVLPAARHAQRTLAGAGALP